MYPQLSGRKRNQLESMVKSSPPARSRVCRVVALASSTGQYGGPYDTARRQALLASALGADVVLIAASLPNDAPTLAAPPGFTFRTLESRWLWGHRFWTLLPSLAMIRVLWQEIGQSKVVHISFAREPIPLLAALFCILRRRRWIAQPHGMMTTRRSMFHKMADTVVVPMLGSADTVIGLTSREVSHLKSLGRLDDKRFVSLGNPLPEGLQLSSQLAERSQHELVFIARLHPRKRVGDFIEAARVANENRSDAIYRVVGPDGGEGWKVKEAANELPNLIYSGAVSAQGVVECLSGAAVFVLCSQDEPWGNVLVTALALGVPVIVARSAALAPEIEARAAGIVVADGDGAAIARAADTIISDPEVASRISENAQRFARQALSDDFQKASLGRLYRSLGWLPRDES